MQISQLVLVGIGGMLGSVARYLTGYLFLLRLGAIFPWGTLAVNLLGSFLIGAFAAAALKWQGSNHFFLFAITGFCGGFTTFSALSYECVTMLKQGNYTSLISYVLISLLGGLAATWIGFSLLK